MMERDILYLAHLYAHQCSSALLRAFAVREYNSVSSTFQTEEAVQRLNDLAKTLGYDLVKRTTASEAAALFHREAA